MQIFSFTVYHYSNVSNHDIYLIKFICYLFTDRFTQYINTFLSTSEIALGKTKIFLLLKIIQQKMAMCLFPAFPSNSHTIRYSRLSYIRFLSLSLCLYVLSHSHSYFIILAPQHCGSLKQQSHYTNGMLRLRMKTIFRSYRSVKAADKDEWKKVIENENCRKVEKQKKTEDRTRMRSKQKKQK